MGSRYTVEAFHFPYRGKADRVKQTKSLFVAIMYVIVWKFKYFGVTLEKRG